MKKFLLPVLVFSFALSAFGQNLPKLSAEEIINKHVESLGGKDAIATAKSRVMTGVGVFTAKTGPGKIGGPAQIATAGEMFLMAMVLNANDYSSEKMAFDGKDLTTSSMPTGGPTPLAEFLKSHKLIVRRGLFGGVFSGGWAPLAQSNEVKLESSGTEKIGGRTLYKIKIGASGLGELKVSMFFEPETFRHVRTQYFYRSGQLTTPNPGPRVTGEITRIGGTSPDNFTLTEDFSNFAKVESLVLPLTYVIQYTTEAGRTMTWTMNFSQAFLNEPLEAKVFKVS